MEGSKKVARCLIIIDIVLCLAGVLLCGLCIFVAVTTYDFRSVITVKLWNSLIGLGSLGAFTLLTGLFGFTVACCYQKKGTILFDAFLLVAAIGTLSTGIFFYIEQNEVSDNLEFHFNATSLNEKEIISNRLNCDLSVSNDDSCPALLDNYFNIFANSIIAGTAFILLLQVGELLVSLMYRNSIKRNKNVRVIPVQPAEMYGNWWIEGGTGGSFYFRHTRQSNPQYY